LCFIVIINKMKIPSSLKKRNGYITRIKPFIRKSVIKVLTGQRRVGKSFLLFQLMEVITTEEPDANIIYINKEDLMFDFIAGAEDLNEYVLSKTKTGEYNYIFIDEIQDIQAFEKALRSLLLDEYNDIYITGSNARMLSGELATYLSGRYIEFNVYSLSYPEFLDFHGLGNNPETLLLYSKYGGLPYLIHLTLEDVVVFEYLHGIYSTIIYRDVVSRYNLRSSSLLEKLVRFLSDNIGNIFTAKRISDFLKSQHVKLAHNQIQVYTEHLTNAFLIHKAERYDLIGKRIFEIGEKYYFENLGIRNVVSGFKPQDMGKILENMVYNDLLYKGYSVKTGSLDMLEIDFVCEKASEKLYVQVALNLESPDTISREFGNLLRIKDNYPKIVVTNTPFSGNTYEGIKHITASEFFMLNAADLH
jgi:uncharacterized protein